MTFISEPGLFDIPAKAYHADCCVTPSLSSSIAKLLIDATPRHAWHVCPRLNPNATVNMELARKTTFGSACHEMFLGKGGGIHRIATLHKDTGEVVTDYKTKAAQQERDEAINAGLVPMLAHDYERAEEVVAEVREQLSWMDLDGTSEVTGVAEFDGVWTRFLMDRLLADGRTILDLKFTDGSASPSEWPKQAARMGYEVQEGHYRNGLARVEGVDVSKIDFLFAVVELGPPLLVCVHSLPIELAEIGLQKATRAREIWGDCLKSGQWPGYQPRVHTGDAPMWVVSMWESRIQTERLGWSDNAPDPVDYGRLMLGA